jgi:hypothetical protein
MGRLSGFLHSFPSRRLLSFGSRASGGLYRLGSCFALFLRGLSSFAFIDPGVTCRHDCGTRFLALSPFRAFCGGLCAFQLGFLRGASRAEAVR